MMLIDASKLDYLKVSSRGLFKVGEIGAKEEYKAVSSPIKVKLAPDILVLFYATAADTDQGKPAEITYSVLKSTERKFKLEYVKDLLNKSVEYYPDRALMKFVHN